MSSYGEYLRRKVATLPKVYGPSHYGDESLRTSVARYKNSQPPLPTLTTSTRPNCCTKSLHWRSTNYRLPSGGPYNARNGNGQQQEWSVDGLISSRAPACLLCDEPARAITVSGCGRICAPDQSVPCCTPDRPSGIYYDASGNSLTKAYQGAKASCCGFQATRETIKALLPDCSCAIDPATRQDTLAADDMPRSPIPYEYPQKECCHYNYHECTNPCCDEDGFLIPQ
jgi:hypothetical protein